MEASGREGIVQKELLGGFRLGQPWFGLGSLLFWGPCFLQVGYRLIFVY